MNVDPLVAYLAHCGLIDAGSVDAIDVRVSDLSRSNLVLSVRLRDGRHLIVKRARPRPGEMIGNMHRELAVYQLAAEQEMLSAAMPVPLWTDSALQVLVMGAVEPGVTLHAYALQHGEPSPGQARRLGELAAGWHRGSRDLSGIITAGRPPVIPVESPWVLGILTGGGWRPPIADRLLVHGEVRRELRAHFAELAAAMEPSCLVHGDLKWDNCLIDGDAGVRVIDWERAAVGDPAWDVAGILQDHLVVRRVRQQPDRWREDAQAALAEAATAFLTGYLDIAAPHDPSPFLERAALLAGARLVQTALEHATVSADHRLARRLLDDALLVLRNRPTLLTPGGAV